MELYVGESEVMYFAVEGAWRYAELFGGAALVAAVAAQCFGYSFAFGVFERQRRILLFSKHFVQYASMSFSFVIVSRDAWREFCQQRPGLFAPMRRNAQDGAEFGYLAFHGEKSLPEELSLMLISVHVGHGHAFPIAGAFRHG